MAGDYAVEIVGEADAVTESTFVSLTLRAPAPAGAPDLLSPADGAMDVGLTPTLSWDAVDGAVTYTLEIATDIGFNEMVMETSTIETSYVLSAALDESTLYYWRVTPANECGSGPVSTIFSFTTQGEGSPPPTEEFIYIPIMLSEE